MPLAGQAQHNKGERERLLGVIEAGFGHLSAFDGVVRELLVKSTPSASLKDPHPTKPPT